MQRPWTCTLFPENTLCPCAVVEQEPLRPIITIFHFFKVSQSACRTLPKAVPCGRGVLAVHQKHSQSPQPHTMLVTVQGPDTCNCCALNNDWSLPQQELDLGRVHLLHLLILWSCPPHLVSVKVTSSVLPSPLALFSLPPSRICKHQADTRGGGNSGEKYRIHAIGNAGGLGDTDGLR